MNTLIVLLLSMSATTHEGTFSPTENSIHWETKPNCANAVVRFQQPLDGMSVEPKSATVFEHGRLVGFTNLSCNVVIRQTQHIEADRAALRPPLLEGEQQTVALFGPVRFTPDAASGLQHVGRGFASQGLSRADVRRERRVAKRGHREFSTVLMLSAADRFPGGISGTIAHIRSSAVWIVTALSASAAVAALLVAMRLLRSRAELERADRVLDAEWQRATSGVS